MHWAQRLRARRRSTLLRKLAGFAGEADGLRLKAHEGYKLEPEARRQSIQ
jgi:hypothetical protein